MYGYELIFADTTVSRISSSPNIPGVFGSLSDNKSEPDCTWLGTLQVPIICKRSTASCVGLVPSTEITGVM